MQTTTYIFADGVTTKTVSDKPALTREQYVSACKVISEAAAKHVAIRQMRHMMHEDEQISLMNRVSHILQQKHKCTKDFSDWKVGELTVSELQDVLDRQ